MNADNTTISYSSKNTGELSAKINKYLHCYKQWLHGNKLTLSVIKAQALIVGSQPDLKKISNNPPVTALFFIVDTNIDTVQNTKYLGVILDQHLIWGEYIKFLKTKISRALGFLKCAKKFLPMGTLSLIYRGIVEPHFRNCCSVWGSCRESRINTLQKLQNRAAREVTNSDYNSSASLLLDKLKWPLINEIVTTETVWSLRLNKRAPYSPLEERSKFERLYFFIY